LAGSPGIRLAADQTYSTLGRKRGIDVCCMAGCVWVTRKGDRNDYLLGSGERLTFRGRGKIVVVALNDSVIRVSGARK
jgi:hypothetical protein